MEVVRKDTQKFCMCCNLLANSYKYGDLENVEGTCYNFSIQNLY
jgi:hypothetical protein